MTARQERLLELLCDGSVAELTAAEEAEVGALLEEAGPVGAWEKYTLERAAVAIAVAGVTPEPMPADLLARIERQGVEALAGASVKHDGGAATRRTDGASVARARRGGSTVAWLAAAACLVLAIGSWLRRPREVVVTKEVVVPVVTPAPTVPPPTPEVERQGLLAREGTRTVEWSATQDPGAAGASGDVVWSPSEQRGFMRFHGLARNDPSVSQYQLWIFDASRDARYPVDGGVFDVAGDGSGDVIVPIRARVVVGDATLFAVTVEKPGGVVVSNREHIVLTAKTKA
jgi:hypothetical protein